MLEQLVCSIKPETSLQQKLCVPDKTACARKATKSEHCWPNILNFTMKRNLSIVVEMLLICFSESGIFTSLFFKCFHVAYNIIASSCEGFKRLAGTHS
jgi:hypothetical protein